jgi:hypothetical protein
MACSSASLPRLLEARTMRDPWPDCRRAPRPGAAGVSPPAPAAAADQFGDALVGQAQQLVHLGAREGRALGRALHFDEVAGAGHDDVHVGVAGDVLDVLEVEQRRAVDDAHRDRRDRAGDRRRPPACRLRSAW